MPSNRTPSNVRTENSSSSDEDENVAGNEIVETPRRRRRRLRQYTFYQPRIQVQPDNLENLEDVFNNTLQTEVREVNGEGKQLYATEGDEIYIGCNKSIQIAFWEYMKHRGPTIFLRGLLEILCGKRDLVNRCFKISKVSTEIQDRSPRKVFTPAKYKILRRLYKDYLDETYGYSSKKKY